MKKTEIRLSIVIPTYNALKFLDVCLESIINSNAKNYEIIIVDNGSTDNTIKLIRSKYNQVLKGSLKIIPLFKNFGPARARNVGVASSRGQFIGFLDSDTIVDKNWSQRALACFRKNRSTGAVQCKLLLQRERGRIDYVGEFLGDKGFLVQLAQHREIDRGQYDKEQNILAAKSAGMFIRRDVFDRVGGFDEDYFIFVEETDLGWRCWLAGYKVVLCPHSIVYHYFSATKDIVDKNFNNHLVRFHGTKNYLTTLTKNLSFLYLVRILPIHIFLWSCLAIFYFFRGDRDSSVNIIKGICWYFCHLTSIINKRRLIQNKRRITDNKLFLKHKMFRHVSLLSMIKRFLYT